MTAQSYSMASAPQRIAMLEDALAKVLDRGGMYVEGDHLGRYVLVPDDSIDCAHEHSLHEIARELEALLP